MIRTFLDAGVLIACARGTGAASTAAESILADPSRMFVSSRWLELELVPKAVFHRRQAEADLYRAYLHGIARTDALPADETLDAAVALACQFGLSACDALHAAVALGNQCDELITSESPGKPLYRLDSRIRVVWLMQQPAVP